MARIVSEIEDLVNDHMDRQPYEISCSECGGKLTVAGKDIDSDKDMMLEVAPCEKCLANAHDEGKREGEKE